MRLQASSYLDRCIQFSDVTLVAEVRRFRASAPIASPDLACAQQPMHAPESDQMVLDRHYFAVAAAFRRPSPEAIYIQGDIVARMSAEARRGQRQQELCLLRRCARYVCFVTKRAHQTFVCLDRRSDPRSARGVVL